MFGRNFWNGIGDRVSTPNAEPGLRRHCIPPARRESDPVGLPAFDRSPQIPGAGFKIRFRIEKLLNPEILDPIFLRPFVSRFSAHLHQPAFAGIAIFLGSNRLSRQTTAFTSIGSR